MSEKRGNSELDINLEKFCQSELKRRNLLVGGDVDKNYTACVTSASRERE